MPQYIQVSGRLTMQEQRVASSGPNAGKPYFFCIVSEPSVDEFSHPTRWGFASNSPLGEVGRDVGVRLEVTSWVRKGKDHRFMATANLKAVTA